MVFTNRLAKTEQTVLDKYSVLFGQPQISDYQANIAAWKRISQLCQEYEDNMNAA